MERRVKRTLFEPQNTLRDLLDMQRDAVTMHRAACGQGFQYKKIERALKPIIGVLPHGV
jgi:hypothetical protein